MTADQSDGRILEGSVSFPIDLRPLVQVDPESNLVVARSIGEYTPVPHIPDGFSLHPAFSFLRLGFNAGKPNALITPEGKDVLLRNRYYEQTDHSLNYFLSLYISQARGDENMPVSILEVGGGYESTAAVAIGGRIESATVTNVDIFLQNTVEGWGNAPRNVTPILGDARKLPVADGSQDVVYSSRVYMYFSDKDQVASFKEVARVLKPGAKAVLFDKRRPAYMSLASKRRLEREVGLQINIWESNVGGYVLTAYKPEESDPKE